jgi:hypothetical protein
MIKDTFCATLQVLFKMQIFIYGYTLCSNANRETYISRKLRFSEMYVHDRYIAAHKAKENIFDQDIYLFWCNFYDIQLTLIIC